MAVTTAMPEVVSRDKWQAARDELLVEEKELTRALDRLAAKRRRLPMVPMQAFAKRMEWSFPFASSHGTTFADDCGAGNGFGISVFLRDGDSEGEKVYQTYFTAGRGCDRLRFDFNLLDLTPYGRQETWEDSPQTWPQTPPYQWWRHHDEY
jgi:predicted dithiol-disulfide oxidoreductase (DUF899 family)